MIFGDFTPSPELPTSVVHSLFTQHDYVPLKNTLRCWQQCLITPRWLLGHWLPQTEDLEKHLLRLLEMGSLLTPKDAIPSRLPIAANWLDPYWWEGPPHPDFDGFDLFPHSLGCREFANPCQVFFDARRRYTLLQWRRLLRDCAITSVCSGHLYELSAFEAGLYTYQTLPKLLDAAWLIYVRQWHPKSLSSSLNDHPHA
jgi:hypothetical protein